MFLNAYAIYDRKGLRYHSPFFAHQDGEAVRMVQDTVNDPSTTLFRHPNDYVLYRVGGYDDASGSLLPVSAIEFISECASLVVPTRGGGSLAERNGEQGYYGDLAEAAALSEKANGKSSIP